LVDLAGAVGQYYYLMARASWSVYTTL